MSESTVVVTPGEGEDAGEDSEHAAAVAEGAAAVHEENAADAAEAAALSAEAASAAAAASIDNVIAAEDAAASAAGSAAAVDAGTMALAEAINAQNTVLSSLVEEIRASRSEPAKPEGKATNRKSKPDSEPKTKKPKGAWYYGG
jgi:hypothetical protein